LSDPNEVRDIGSILSEASQQGYARSLVSPAPQTAVALQNPLGQICLGCGHGVIEQNCSIHSNSEEYVYFAGFTPAGFYHRRCLQKKLDERARELREAYGNPQVQAR
jgi:hypothetical protein